MLDTQGRVDVAVQVQRQFAGRMPSFQGEFFFSRPSTDWMWSIHITGVICFNQSTNLNANFIEKNTFIETSRIMLGQISRDCSSVKLTYKINHNRR
jgi:hypothetical protein